MTKEPMWRLTADENKLITDGGEITGTVIDVAPNVDPDIFYEIDDPNIIEEEETNND